MNMPHTDISKSLDLQAVLTIPEIVQRWGKTRKSVLMAIYKGDFTARKSANTWLVHCADVVARWGNPELEEN